MVAEFLESLPELLESISESAPAMARKLARSVGKAAWLAGTTFLVLGVPLIWAMEREAMTVEMENAHMAEQAVLLGTNT